MREYRYQTVISVIICITINCLDIVGSPPKTKSAHAYAPGLCRKSKLLLQDLEQITQKYHTVLNGKIVRPSALPPVWFVYILIQIQTNGVKLFFRTEKIQNFRFH